MSEPELNRPEVRRAFVTKPIPAPWRRFTQRFAMRANLITYERDLLRRELRARRFLLGDRATGTPRLLVRVDEFPDSSAHDHPERAGIEASRRFHGLMAEAGVSYLMAVVPQLTARPLDPQAGGGRPLGESELELLAAMARDGVVFAQHGTTHRTRDARPRYRSELLGLSPATTAQVVDRGLATLRGAEINPRVFVPPFNRFDATHYEVLASRFTIVCGGPETVPLMGFQRGPQWRGAAVYLPCYPPFYGRARDILPALQRLLEAQVGACWIPVVLHLAWEADDGWTALKRLAPVLASAAVSWDLFLEAVERSR